MAEMAKKLYGSSPKMERDGDGKMSVKKKTAEKDTEANEAEDKDGSGQPLPVMVRHSMDRAHLHAKHETEHAMHDHGKGGDKHEMHMRHMADHEAMMKAHEKELKAKEKE